MSSEPLGGISRAASVLKGSLLEFEPIVVAGQRFAPLLVRLTGEEELSQPYCFELELIWDGAAPSAAKVVGQNVSASVLLANGTKRWFNGHVRRFVSLGKTHGGRRYLAEVVPWLWFLSQSTACRVLYRGGAEITTKDAVEELLRDLNGVTNFEWSGTGANRSMGREYRVQYHESDLNFVSRVLEEAGIYYFFRHEKGSHKLILCDPPIMPDACVGGALDLVESSMEGVHGWEHACRFISQKFSAADYAENSSEVPTGQAAKGGAPTKFALPHAPGNGKISRFEFPGGFWTDADGEKTSDLRMEELEASFQVASGTGSHRSFEAGTRFSFREDESLASQDFLLVSVAHEIHSPLPVSGAGHAAGSYVNHFECLPTKIDADGGYQTVIYRPPRVAPRPTIQGPQTAIVVGRDGTTTVGETDSDKVNVDQYGRVRVKFPWQTVKTPKSSDAGSCWVRVSQTWAGNGWGSMHIPWIGHEVIVEFLDGDPERPLITGRVYNAITALPKTHELPTNKLHTVLAADSAGNEIFFDGNADGVRGIGMVTADAEGDGEKSSTTKAAVMLGVTEGMTYVTNEASKAIHLGSEFKLAGGATFEAFVGGKAGITVGQASEIFVGTNLELALSANQGYVVGTNYEFKAGADIGFVVGDDLSFKMGSSCEVSLTRETGFNMLGTGLISAKEVALVAGKANVGSVVVNSELAELRYGKSSEHSWVPLVGMLASAVTTGAAGAIESITGLVPMVSSSYAALTKLVEAGAGIAITASTAPAASEGSSEDDKEGNSAMTSWARETGAGINEQVEGFVSGGAFAAVGLIEGAALAIANLAICEIAITLLKMKEAAPAAHASGVLRADEQGVTLVAGADMPGAKDAVIVPNAKTCSVELKATSSELCLKSGPTAKIELKSDPQIELTIQSDKIIISSAGVCISGASSFKVHDNMTVFA